jgi:predicted Holliday junction resolvase-like endonuclease
MQTIIAAVVFGLILITVIVMIVIYLAYKGVRKIKQEAEDNYYRSQKRKEQKEKNPFGDDYFKSASSKKQRAQSQYQPRQEPFQEKVRQEQPKEDTARSKTTSSGVTIIDDRSSDEKRKIFDRSDGEYVEFEEV